jgi:hypothetical protein
MATLTFEQTVEAQARAVNTLVVDKGKPRMQSVRDD